MLIPGRIEIVSFLLDLADYVGEGGVFGKGTLQIRTGRLQLFLL